MELTGLIRYINIWVNGNTTAFGGKENYTKINKFFSRECSRKDWNMDKGDSSMTMAIISKEIILKMRKEEKENIISVKAVFSSHNLIQTHLKYQK